MRHLHVKNVGEMAFQYKLMVAAGAEVSQLADAIDVYCIAPAQQVTSRADLAGVTPVGTLTDVLGGLALNGVDHLLSGEEAAVTIALKMREEAGNEYMNMSIGSDFAVQLLATQYAYEEDSFGSDYDAEAVFPVFSGHFAATADVTGKVDANNCLTEDVMIGSVADGMYALVKEGTKLEKGTTRLTLKVNTTTRSSDIEMTMGQVSRSLDVHIDGIAANNTVPVMIDLGAVMPKGLKDGNIDIYHVEDGEPKKMKQVETLKAHNQFTYDAETGKMAVMMATFSEVTAVVAANNSWNGDRDYDWYNTTDTSFTIDTAEKFAGFAAIVGGMAPGIDRDDFAGKTVTLGADLDLGGLNNKLWYPVGYYNSEKSYTKTSGGSVNSDLYSFKGIFDGNNKTISNIYQNTWDMFGDYNNGYSGTPNHYKDGMGIFGFVLNGKVKNLNVSNFQSDGEFCTTGVVAAYASGSSTFENINIYNSNPRAYNVPNGGVVGYAYDEKGNTNVINFNKVKVDASNKISALWGSWDVGCGGILGRVNGKTTVNMKDCTVGAVIDVFNDVCGNYQYYQYRYSGMLIGTVGGDSDPKNGPEVVTFNNVKVYLGSYWADYYYCEFAENTQGSYTDDYQFSRVEWDEIEFDEWNMPVGCTHDHSKDEDKRFHYLPFDQLYTGYGWGASPVKAAPGVEVIRFLYRVDYMDALGKTTLKTVYVEDPTPNDDKHVANEYTVLTQSISTPGVVVGSTATQSFNGWVNTSSTKITSIPKGNRNNVVLYESWKNPYIVRWVDLDGNVVYAQTFVPKETKIDVPAIPNIDGESADMEVEWEPHEEKCKNATGDVTIHLSYKYTGYLDIVPVYEDGDNEVDYYKVIATSNLPEKVEIPGQFMGKPVKVVEILYKNESNMDYGSAVKEIVIGEGVEELPHNALSHTQKLEKVTLPSTITTLGKNVFSRNNTLGAIIGASDIKKLTIIYNGTMAEWEKVLENSSSDWDGGLQRDSRVECTDGYFTKTSGAMGHKWSQSAY